MDEKKDRISGPEILHNPLLNKGTAFTEEERDALGLRGLLPPRVFTQKAQQTRNLENYRRKSSNLDKYMFLMSLMDRNERLFYRTVLDNLEEMMPIIYTPTVGEACKRFAHIFQRPRGLYVSAHDRGRVAEVFGNWPEREVSVIVVTDGERILGLGDLGASGMGIPIGKLALYTVCAGIDPRRCLPIMLDVGTENEEFLDDPLYFGILERRLRDGPYDELVEELILSVQEVYPGALIQFEDFANRNAFRLLDRYRDRVLCFNDDIQGTASVVLAGLYSAIAIQGRDIVDQTFVFLGAGSAARGIADLLVSAMAREGLPEAEARKRCWFVDSTGLVVKGREPLREEKRLYAHEHEFLSDLGTVIERLRPTALIGVSGQPRTFTQRVVESMAEINETPIIFALSNPTSKAECTAEEAYGWSGGRAVFAGGSPFPPVRLGERTLVPGQGNNAYIFPGLGLGVIASGASRVTDEMFLAAARSLADQVSEADRAKGLIYPPLNEIRDVSAAIAARVVEVARSQGLARNSLPADSADLVAHMRSNIYEPRYENHA